MIKSNNNVYQGKLEDFMYNYFGKFLGEEYKLNSVERKEIVEDLLKKFIKNQSPSLLNDVNNIKCDNKYSYIKNFIINHLTSDNQLTYLNTYMILYYIKYLKECEKLEENDIKTEITKVIENFNCENLIKFEDKDMYEYKILSNTLALKNEDNEYLMGVAKNVDENKNSVKRRRFM